MHCTHSVLLVSLISYSAAVLLSLPNDVGGRGRGTQTVATHKVELKILWHTTRRVGEDQ
jgi:hypothetical protein